MFPKRVKVGGFASILILIALFLAALLVGEKQLPHLQDVSKKNIPVLTIIPTITIIKSPQSVQSAQDTVAVVASVHDGDTFTMADKVKVRLLGVNAPEVGQPYSAQSTQTTKEFVLGQKLRFETDAASHDKYGRLLVYVYVGNTMVNTELVKRGMAIVEIVVPNKKYQKLLQSAQDDAKKNCRGLWSGLCSDPQARCIVIDTIHADAAGDDNKNKNDEWVKFSNSCATDVTLSGFLLKDNSASNSYKFPQYSLSAKKSVLLHSGCGTDTADNLFWKCPELSSTVWNNVSDHAYLYNENDALIADFGY